MPCGQKSKSSGNHSVPIVLVHAYRVGGYMPMSMVSSLRTNQAPRNIFDMCSGLGLLRLSLPVLSEEFEIILRVGAGRASSRGIGPLKEVPTVAASPYR